jgi:hypothetical protein
MRKHTEGILTALCLVGAVALLALMAVITANRDGQLDYSRFRSECNSAGGVVTEATYQNGLTASVCTGRDGRIRYVSSERQFIKGTPEYKEFGK